MTATEPLQGGRVRRGKADGKGDGDGDGKVERARILERRRANSAEFERLYRVVTNRAYRTALLGTDRHTAQDVAQDVGVAFLRLWSRSPSAFPNNRAVEAWAVKTARTRLVDRVRADESRSERDYEFAAFREEVREEWEDDEAAETLREKLDAVVREALDGMPKQRREIVLAVREEGATYETVAADRGVSLDGVKYHVTRALKDLREAVNEWRASEPAEA